ncbi:hypothetical protein Emag_007197 [Eimeria magna]
MASLLQRYGAPVLLLNLLRNSGAHHRVRAQQPAGAAATAAAAAAARRLTRTGQQTQTLQPKELRREAGANADSEAPTGSEAAAGANSASSIQRTPIAVAAAAGPAAADARDAPAAASSAAAQGDESPYEESAAAATTAEQEGSLGECYQKTVDLLNQSFREPPQGGSGDMQLVWVVSQCRRMEEGGGLGSCCKADSGVCRLNCLDSLDRTNELQLHVHRAFVLRFLKMLPAAFVIDPALDEAVLRAVAFLTDATGDDVALQYGVAHRKRLVPLAWAAQLPPLGFPASADSQLSWAAPRFSGNPTASSFGAASKALPLATAAGSVAAHGMTAKPPSVSSSSSSSSSNNNNNCSSSDTSSSSLLTALQQLPGSVAARWLWATKTTGAPLLPGLSTSLQRSSNNNSSSSSSKSRRTRSRIEQQRLSVWTILCCCRYANILEDGRKQQSLNLWFGLYRPLTSEGVVRQPPLWKLDDAYDVYVHHRPSSAASAAATAAARAAAAAAAAAGGMSAANNRRCICGAFFSINEPLCLGASDFSCCLACCSGPSAQPFASTADVAATTAAASETTGRETIEALLKCLGGAAWVSYFLPASSVCTADGVHPCESLRLWTARGSLAGELNAQQFLQIFTYTPWRQRAAAAAAAAAAATVAAAGAATAITAAFAPQSNPAVGSLECELQDGTRGYTPQAPTHSATSCMRPSSSPSDNKTHNSSRISSKQSSSSSSSNISSSHWLMQLYEHCDGVSLALLLPALLDPAAAAARASSCCRMQQLREEERKGVYTSLQQQQQEQEEDERMGASSIACWAPPLVLLQQRSSGSPWQQRLLQAHRALRFKPALTVDRSPYLLATSATVQQAGAAACRSGPSEAAAAGGHSLLLSPPTSKEPWQPQQQQQQQQQDGQPKQLMRAAAAAFKRVLREQLRRHRKREQQQLLLLHRRALASLPIEVQQALQDQVEASAVAGGVRISFAACNTCAKGTSSSRGSSPSCWELAAKGGLQQQAVEVYVQQENRHRARLLRQQRELTACLLHSSFGALAPVGAAAAAASAAAAR